jgi:hypothetical protein
MAVDGSKVIFVGLSGVLTKLRLFQVTTAGIAPDGLQLPFDQVSPLGHHDLLLTPATGQTDKDGFSFLHCFTPLGCI